MFPLVLKIMSSSSQTKKFEKHFSLKMKTCYGLPQPLKGFTLIELLVVVAVLALLASIVFSNLGGAREGARISNALSFQSQTHSLLGSDLVGWWNFNDPSDRYKDLSGYGNDGSCISCPTVTDGVPGTMGAAMEFNGVGNYVEILDFTLGKASTINGWAGKITDKDDYNPISANGSSLQNGIYLRWNTNHWKVNFRGNSSATINSVVASMPSSFDAHDWHHYVGVSIEGVGLYLYIDGELVESNTTDFTETSIADGFRIGHAPIHGDRFMEGLIDDVRIYNRALTAGEINKIYAETKGKHLTEIDE